MTDTLPTQGTDASTAARVVVPGYFKDITTGQVWIHKDLVSVTPDWPDEQHIAPAEAHESLGDVESWVAFVKEYSGAPDFPPYLTWNSAGLKGVLDFHGSIAEPGRCQFVASHPFERSPEWTAWLGIAHGRGVPQRSAVEFLDDHSPDITEPDAASLMAILSSLRASVNKTATTELRPDGTTSVTWSDQKNLAARGGTADLPPEFSITIPILKGHPTRYKLVVKLRASVDDQAHLALRFTIPQSEQALELVYDAIVKHAKTLLGDGFALLRAAG